MHVTTAVLKDGRTIKGIILRSRPAHGFIILDSCSVKNHGISIVIEQPIKLEFNDLVCMTTEGERGQRRSEDRTEDDLAKAKKYLSDGRKFGWTEDEITLTPDFPLQDWENGE